MQLTQRQTWVAMALVVLLFAFTMFQASWITSEPTGGPKLVASKGSDPIRDQAGCLANDNMAYQRAQVGPDIATLQIAAGFGADAVQVPTDSTGGELVVARTYKSPCASDMTRPRSSVAAAVASLTKPVRIWRVKGAVDAQKLLASLPMSNEKDMVMGDADAVKAIAAARPMLRAFTVEEAHGCTSRYRTTGIWGSIPAECRNKALLFGLDEIGYTLWGWPNRFLARVNDAGVPVFIAASVNGDTITGLTDIKQYGEIAHSYNGYIWIDNIDELGPALKR